MKIKVIGDEFTCMGFDLTGVTTAIAKGREKLKEEFNNSLQDEQIGLIFITEKEADRIRELVEKQKTEGELPLVVEIPTRKGWKEREKALNLINRVLSVQI